MAMWKPSTPASKAEPAHFEPPTHVADLAGAPSAPARSTEPTPRESVLAADLTIEGKIEGTGHVRIAGKFKGDIKVQGNLMIDPGAKVSGSVNAGKVVLAGELEGNILAAKQVELLATGVLNGDLKAGSLTVAAGSRLRGHVECGWEQDTRPATKAENGRAT